PRSSQSPPPSGPQGDLELELLGLTNALYNLGTTVINDSTKEREKSKLEKLAGPQANEVISHLSAIDGLAQHSQTMIPFQVLADIDSARNPFHLTKERLERAAAENQFMNGKMAAINSYSKVLNDSLTQNFPQTSPHIQPR
ncbi:mediator complex, subunit Med10, partial [Hygrophoropsis aurantiaca]